MRSFSFALCFSALLSAPLPALAQSALEFQEELLETANAAGSARLPVACAGLFRALTNLAEEGTDQHKTRQEKEQDSGTVAAIARQNETGEDTSAAIDGVVVDIAKVATVYLNWFSANKKATGELFDDTIKQNFGDCDRLVGEWRGALYAE